MTPITTEFDFRSECFMEIISYYSSLGVEIDPKDIYVVWQTKALQNFKALLSTNIPDTRYFEITYNIHIFLLSSYSVTPLERIVKGLITN